MALVHDGGSAILVNAFKDNDNDNNSIAKKYSWQKDASFVDESECVETRVPSCGNSKASNENLQQNDSELRG